MSDVKEKKPRSRAPAHVWTAGTPTARDGRDEANNFFLRLLKGECDEQGFFARVKAKKFARGKAMARRRLQRRCETKGRCLKTTPCTWDGSLSHDELGEILGGGSTRPSICAGTGLHVLPILSIVIGASLSEPHSYVLTWTFVIGDIYIYI